MIFFLSRILEKEILKGAKIVGVQKKKLWVGTGIRKKLTPGPDPGVNKAPETDPPVLRIRIQDPMPF